MFLLNLTFDWWTGFYNIQSLQELRVIIHPRCQVVPSSPDPASILEGVTVALRRSSKCSPDCILSWVRQHPITTVNTVECCFDLLSRLTFAGTTLRQTESLVPWRHQTPPTSEVFASATARAALCLTFCHLSAVYGVPQANYTRENSFINLKVWGGNWWSWGLGLCQMSPVHPHYTFSVSDDRLPSLFTQVSNREPTWAYLDF